MLRFIICGWLLLLLDGCSLESNVPRSIRAHVDIKQGVAHARGSQHAERYCKSCHGIGLLGGKEAQPSCYVCHGQNWLSSDPTTPFAPADHTIERRGFFHHPDSSDPVRSCAACHGKDLLGDASGMTPSCLLCHDQLW